MKKFKFILLYFLIISSFCDCKRIKRRVVFRKNSKMFLRLNGIEPFLKYNTIFRHGWGFRANWPLPDTTEKFHKLYQRDIHNDINELAEKPDLKDYICILKYFSEMISSIKYDENCEGGVLCNIAKIISRSKGDDVQYFKSFFNKFTEVPSVCPAMNYVPAPYEDV